ncbi:hypothetical protein ABK040_002555 [Willaertia magna]
MHFIKFLTVTIIFIILAFLLLFSPSHSLQQQPELTTSLTTTTTNSVMTAGSSSGSNTSNCHTIQLDIEPYSLNEWKINQNQVANDFLDLIEKIQLLINQFIQNKIISSNVRISFAIPRWFNTISINRNKLTKPLSEFILNITDIVIMDYVDSSERAINDAKDELIYGSNLNSFTNSFFLNNKQRKIFIALETMELKDEPMATFYGKTNEYFEKAILDIDNNFKQYSSYSGIAIHYLDSWKILNSIPIINSTAPLRDLYIWNYDFILNETKRNDLLFNYLLNKKANSKIRTIYLESAYLLIEKKIELLNFVNLCKNYSINVELLTGDASWALPNNHKEALKFVDNAIRFLSVVSPPGNDSNSGNPVIDSMSGRKSSNSVTSSHLLAHSFCWDVLLLLFILLLIL